QERDNREENGRRADENGVGEADDQKANAIENAITNGHEHLPAEEGDEIIVDGIEHEDEFMLESGIGDGQVIAPAGGDAAFLQQEIKRVNGDQRQPGNDPEPQSNAAEEPRTGGLQSFRQQAGSGL